MAKAMLIMDMPNSCIDCPCLFTSEGYQECEAIVNTIEIDIETEKPTWCPLREPPKKFTKGVKFLGAMYGWNACIDEILGETE